MLDVVEMYKVQARQSQKCQQYAQISGVRLRLLFI